MMDDEDDMKYDYNDVTQEEVTRLNELLINLRDMDKWDDATKNAIFPDNYGNIISDLSMVIWDIEIKKKFKHHRSNANGKSGGSKRFNRSKRFKRSKRFNRSKRFKHSKKSRRRTTYWI